MSPGLVTESGTTKRCRSSSPSFQHPARVVLPPFYPSHSSSKTRVGLPPSTRKGWSKGPPGHDQINRKSTYGYGNDLDTSQVKRPRLSSSSFHFGSLPTTLPPPTPTLPPPYSTSQPLSMPLTLPPLPFPPPFGHANEDLRRLNTSQQASGRPLTASSSRSQSPMEARPLLPPSGKNRGQDAFSSQPPTSHSRRSGQASSYLMAVEEQRNSTLVDSAARRTSVASVPTAPSSTPAKSRRVRTGCLTCRERHLKCDESLPDCLNCRKGNRDCKRGLRLNFIDVQVKPVPYVPTASSWKLSFLDESRAIASEYVGGSSRYPRVAAAYPSRDVAEDVTAIRVRPLPTVIGGGNSSSACNKDPSKMQPQRSGSNCTTNIAVLQQDKGLNLLTIKAQVHARSHSHRHSDASSVTSSMVPQGMGPPSTASFREGVTNSPTAGFVSLDRLGEQDILGIPADILPDGLPTPPSEKAALVKSNSLDAGLCLAGGFETGSTGSKAGEKEYLNSPDEIRFMQTFLDDVAVWMDSLDKEKHFSRKIPFLALKSPMLLNASLACGVKHLTLVGQSHHDDKALFYYDTATTQLLRSLQNPDRNIAECATTAVVLNVYEVMSEKPNDRMSHIAGARALIRECGWNARSVGIGAACFWLNIGMEVLSCLSFNWPTAWEPDQWGLDLDFAIDSQSAREEDNDDNSNDAKRRDSISSLVADADFSALRNRKSPSVPQSPTSGVSDAHECIEEDDEVWMHRIFYIVAKIANFRANTPRSQEPSPHDEQVRLQNRFAEWKRLKALCDIWNRDCPRSMKPFGYLFSGQNTLSNSLFPNVWLTKGAGVISRLFYHTAMVLLHQVNPIESNDSLENHRAQLHHAHQVCGIVAHNKDGGVTSVAIRSLAVAAQVLCDRREQDEVLSLIDRIAERTCWRIGKIYSELKQTWGRDGENPILSSVPSPPTGLGLSDISGNFLVGHGPGCGTDSDSCYQPPPCSTPRCSVFGNALCYSALHPTEVYQPSAVANASSASVTISPPSVPVSLPYRSTPRTMNPLLHADFSLPDHPYKAFYKPPNETTPLRSHSF